MTLIRWDITAIAVEPWKIAEEIEKGVIIRARRSQRQRETTEREDQDHLT